MDRMLPVEVMLCFMDEIKMFLLSNPDEERKLTEVLMISYTLINMVNTGLYWKSIESWKNLTASDLNKGVECRAFFIAEYERMLREGQDTTNAKEGYGGMFNAMEGDDGDSIVEAITQYSERATSAESKTSEMESELSQLKLDTQNPQTAYFSPR